MKKRVFITGASRGLGLKLANKFEEEGHLVLKHKGKEHYDLSCENEIKALVKEAQDFGAEVLVNNASITCPGIKFKEYDLNQIQKMIDVNLTAPIKILYLLHKSLKSVININSILGLEVKPYRSIYSSLKYGLRGFSNSLKMENKKLNILDIYTSSFSGPDPSKHMKIELVVNAIYEAFKNKKKELIIDGRKSIKPIIKEIS